MWRWFQKHQTPLGARPDGTGLEPVSRTFGYDRGRPICRYYIENFLERHAADIRGRTLEVADATYTNRFGGSKVTQADVLHAVAGNKQATLIGDLTTGQGIPQSAFDCMVATQLFPFIYDMQAVVRQVFAALKPGGVLLATGSGISQISRYDMDRWGDYWRFTTASAGRLFGDVFGADRIEVKSHGNVLVACGYLRGLASEEFSKEELEHYDADYQLLVTVRAVKKI